MEPLVPGVHVGGYSLDVGTDSGSFAHFASKREKANAKALSSALADSEPTLVAEVERFEEKATAVADRIERANELSRAAASGRLLEGDVLMVEIDSLLGLLERLDRDGRFEEQLRLARAMYGLLAVALRWLDLIRMLRGALRAAQKAGDQAGQAWALHELGSLHLVAGDSKRAAELLDRALHIQDGVQQASWCATRHNLDSARRDSRSTRHVDPGRGRRLLSFGTVVVAVAVLGVSATPGPGITGPRISLPSASLDLGRVAVGNVGRAQFRATNAGTTPATLTRVASNLRDFRTETNCLRVLQPGEDCEVRVRFEPQTLGLVSAILTIGGDRIHPPPVRLSGTGVALEDPMVEPNELDLGSVPVGRQSEPQGVTVTAGQRALTISGVAVDSAEFSAESGCSATIAARSRCSISIQFRPREAGTRRATLTISRPSGGPFTVALAGLGTTGQGAAGRLAVSPARVDFGRPLRVGEHSTPRHVRLTNVGDSTISDERASVSGADDFELAPECPAILAPAESCDLQVTFSPRAAGARNAALTIEGGPGKPMSVPLRGIGIGVSAQPTFVPSSHDFGVFEVLTSTEPYSFTLTAGSDTVTPEVKLLGANDFALENRCGLQLAPRQSCSLNVTFTPAEEGRREGTLTVRASGEAAFTAALVGVGEVVPSRLTPSRQDFGTVDVGVGKSGPHWFTLFAGSKPLSFTASLRATKDFELGGGCSGTLEPHTNCTFAVTFAPIAGGIRRARLVVVPTDGPTLSAAVTGIGNVIPAALVPKAFDFGTISLGSRSSPTTFKVTAGSFALARPTHRADVKDFSVSRNGCVRALPPFAACTFDVVFAPTAFGRRRARLRLAGLSGLVGSVTGYGWAQAMWWLNPKGLNIEIGEGQGSATKSVILEVSRTSPAPLMTSRISRTGSDYFEASSDCPTRVQPGSTCTITVTLTPTGLLVYPDNRATFTISTRNGGRKSLRVSGKVVPTVD